MFTLNEVSKILIENAITLKEKNQIYSLKESDQNIVNNTMISNLYKSAIEKAHVDFNDIPNSKGDLTKFSGFKSMLDSVDLLHQLSNKTNVKIDELDILDKAINNIINYKESFEKGFKLEKEFIILQYNILVCACIEGLSSIISSYVDFIKRPDRIEFTLIKSPQLTGRICIMNLEKFNSCVRSGEFGKVIKSVIDSGKEGFVGTETLMIGTLIVGGVLVLVPLMRELIFYFYYSRLKISEYLKTQALFLEINKNNINMNSSLNSKNKKQILDRQQTVIRNLQALSDKIRVDDTTSTTQTYKNMNTENKGWSLGSVKTQSASVDGNGFKLL